MQIKDVRPESYVKQIRCDRCGRLSSIGEAEFHESFSIELQAGYSSIFGDGNEVQIDLCQHCLAAALGPWLRVSDPVARQGQLVRPVSLFNLDQHGEEYPTVTNAPPREPEGMPPGDSPSLISPVAPIRRRDQLKQAMRHSMRLHVAPLTGLICAIGQRRQRMARLGRARRRQAAFVGSGPESTKRSETSHDWISADPVMAKLRAKADARSPRLLGFLKGRFKVPPTFDEGLPSDVLQDFEGSATKDSKLAMIARLQNDPNFAVSLIDEAIELVRNGECEVAKRSLLDLICTGVTGQLSSREVGQAPDV